MLVKRKWLKLREFTISFYAVSSCKARNKYLLLQSARSTSGTQENTDYSVFTTCFLKAALYEMVGLVLVDGP